MKPRLALGTVQFGIDYGIANKTGQVNLIEARRILRAAKSLDINILDTAPGYGSSEKIIGDSGPSGWSIVTKLNIADLCGALDYEAVNALVNASMKALKCDKLHALLIHDPDSLHNLSGNLIWRSLIKLKERGLVEKIGYSVYSPVQLEQLVRVYPPDIVQLPVSVADRRFLDTGWIAQLADMNVETHARSLFMQGALLLQEKMRPRYLNKMSTFFEIWDDWLANNSISSVEACVKFGMSLKDCSALVFGAQTLEQLNQIYDASRSKKHIKFSEDLQIHDESILNPSMWMKS